MTSEDLHSRGLVRWKDTRFRVLCHSTEYPVCRLSWGTCPRSNHALHVGIQVQAQVSKAWNGLVVLVLLLRCSAAQLLVVSLQLPKFSRRRQRRRGQNVYLQLQCSFRLILKVAASEEAITTIVSASGGSRTYTSRRGCNTACTSSEPLQEFTL